MKTIIAMAEKAGGFGFVHDAGDAPHHWQFTPKELKRFAELVRADERRRITNLMLYMHNKASPYHNYYKHAAVEINRRDGEGEKI